MNEHEHEQLSALISALAERDALRTEVEHLRGTNIGKIVKERDALQREVQSLKVPAPPPVPPGWGPEALSLGTILNREYNESPKEAAEPAQILELKGFRVGDLVRRPSKPYSQEHAPIERLGQGHGGYWYVYVRASKEEASGGGGWNPEDMTRKPIEDGDTVRFVGSQPKPSGPWRVKSIQDRSATVTCGDTLMSVPLSGLVAVAP